MAAFTVIEHDELSSPTATWTSGTFATTYDHLYIVMSARHDYANYYSGTMWQFNGDTGSNYSNHILRGTGSSATAYRQTGVAYIQMSDGMHGSSMPAANYATFILDIVDYANTNKNTTCSFMAGSALGHTDNRVQFGSGLWDDTAAITTVLFTPNAGSFSRGSEFTLYGLND